MIQDISIKHDIGYDDFKDLPRRTASDKVLCDKAFNIAERPKYYGYQRGLTSVILGGAFKSEIMSNQELTEELHKSIIRKFEKRKVHSSFIDNIWGLILPICN